LALGSRKGPRRRHETAAVIRARRLKGRQDAEHWQRTQEKYLAESRVLLAEADDAQYETGVGPTHSA
jgi:hypothetical protein